MSKIPYDPKSFYHWTEIPVRFRDLDPLNHVNNAVFFTYFEEARISFIRHVPVLRKSMRENKSFVLAKAEIDYIKPIELTDKEITVGSSVESFGNSSLEGIQAIYSKHGKELKAIARTTGVWFDLDRNRPSRLPEIPDKEQYVFQPDQNG